MFADHFLTEQQTEKRYLRRMQKIATESLSEGDVVPLRKRLLELLDLISEAMEVDTSGLLFYKPDRQELCLVASSRGILLGSGPEARVGCNEAEPYVVAMDSPCFAAKVATSESPLYIADARTADLDIGEPLAQSDVRSLLGLSLHPRGKLFGVLYIGARKVRSFDSQEVRIFESLGERLGILLDNARLHEQLGLANQQLRAERIVREQFVSILAHDLLGPMSAAKMGVQLLFNRLGLQDERRSIATRINHNIDRTNRMIRDLLDVDRIHAGKRLSLRIGETDLRAVAQSVLEELTLIHGARFVLKGAEHLGGMWSAEELSRAIWNLAVNGIRYGAADVPIVITITGDHETAQVVVHNEGPPIAPEDQKAIFDPFFRTQSVQTRAVGGWGLGLALVRGCAEAHGGTIDVKSAPEAGTTFTLKIPYDARPFQTEVRVNPSDIITPPIAVDTQALH